MKSAALLEEALPAHPDHPGLLHYMRDLAQPLAEFPLPDPDLIWLRARILARAQEAERELWRTTYRKMLHYGLIAGGLAWLSMDVSKLEGVSLDAHFPTVLKLLGWGDWGTTLAPLFAAGTAVFIAFPRLRARLRFLVNVF